jgi:hypothetical protein
MTVTNLTILNGDYNPDIPIAEETNFTSFEKFKYNHVNNYFRKTSVDNINLMIDILRGNSKISLRLLDWFITKHAFNDQTYIETTSRKFYINVSYKSQLKTHKKQYFDPFKRYRKSKKTNKVGKFYYAFDRKDKSKRLLITIGQLNFFRWAFENNIIVHVTKNYTKLNNLMTKEKSDQKKLKKKKSSEVVKPKINILEKCNINKVDGTICLLSNDDLEEN